ncbi:hypothetical protein VPH35_133769 [Triticum aestivum]
MSSSSSRATSRMQSRARVDMPVFVCPRCRAGVDRRVSQTPRNQNRPFYVCSENGVTCFFLWVDALAKTLMNELQEEHEEWLRMLHERQWPHHELWKKRWMAKHALTES